MANPHYTNTTTLIPGQVAKASEVEAKLDAVEAGFDSVETKYANSLGVNNPDAGVVIITENAANRANNVIGFDTNGDIQLQPGVGEWKGNWAGATVYGVRDVVRDAAGDLGLNNLYICITPHTSTTDIATDTANWSLLLDITAVEAAKVAAEAAQTAAETAESNAATSESNAATSASNASTSAGNAATSESNAATSESNAATSASNASTSESNAATSASDAQTAETGAEAAWDNFRGQYLGPLANDPTLDALSNPVGEGDLYWNTNTNAMRVHDGTGWSNLGAASQINNTELTATAGQTVFTVHGYSAGFEAVFLNGRRLGSTDYATTNATTITLSAGADIGDHFEMVSFEALSTPDNSPMIPSRNGVLNGYALSQGQSSRTGFSAAKYTGAGITQSITTGVDSSTGDFGALIWLKNRDFAASHELFDTVRGPYQRLITDSTAAESTQANSIESFNPTGFGVGTGNRGANDSNADEYIAWSWQTNQKVEPTYGSNLVQSQHDQTTFDFGSTIGSWLQLDGQSGLSTVGNRLRVTNNDASAAGAVLTMTVEVGKVYTMQADVFAGTAGTGDFRVGTTSGSSDVTSRQTVVGNGIVLTFVAPVTTVYLTLLCNSVTTSQYTEFDNVYLRETTAGYTNREKLYTCHYNTDLGFSIVGYEGDGDDGHEIPHHLGGQPELVIFKELDNANGWVISSPLFPDEYVQLNSSNALAATTTAGKFINDDTIYLGESNSVNRVNSNHVAYIFKSVPGVSKVGKYIGVGTNVNYVKCGFKPAFVMMKNLTTGGTSWGMVDTSRGIAEFLYANQNVAEINSASIEAVADGFVLTSNSVTHNSLNNEYIFLAFAESSSDANKVWGDYTYATSQDTLSIEQNTLLSFANGFGGSGQTDAQELVGAGVTVTFGAGWEDGHFYLYKDKDGSYGATEIRPLIGTTRDDADKWGVESPLDASLRTTAKHFDYESETGVVLASNEFSGTYYAWRAFKSRANDILGPSEDYWAADTTSGFADVWLQYKFNEKRILKSWRFREGATATQTPDNFKIQGSNDGAIWTDIDTTYDVTNYSTVANGVLLWGPLHDVSANTTAYLYLRMLITDNAGHASATGIMEMEFNTISPADYFLLPDGVMYAPSQTELITNGTFDSDLSGWTVNSGAVTWDASGRALQATDVGYLAQGFPTEIGKRYSVTFDLEISGATVQINIGSSIGDNDIIHTYTATGSYSFSFVATQLTTYISFDNVTAGTSYLDNMSCLVETGTPINRMYLGEVWTNADGEVSRFENYEPAKQDFTEAEVQKNLKVHGEIENRGVCTAWVNFDGSENPPLIKSSYNVKDVVDIGTGQYEVIFETPMDHSDYSYSITGNNYHNIAMGDSANVNSVRINTFNSAHAYSDGSVVTLSIFGGKEIK